MVEPITYVFMGISALSVALNIPLLKSYWRCSCINDGRGEMSCKGSCKEVEKKIKPKLRNVCSDYIDECETKQESKATTP